ncbi:hypothetical protein PRK78_006287 [Emydomyces testavorans]|uniref:Uncharacterized protein n=1 Tax=Emydomyces testavorans TaxID=2070801 RepID=A0AAF0DM53_9EURO|nr:hypothetical protein PRK78_006287 [Emydomyces testavorans]
MSGYSSGVFGPRLDSDPFAGRAGLFERLEALAGNPGMFEEFLDADPFTGRPRRVGRGRPLRRESSEPTTPMPRPPEAPSPFGPRASEGRETDNSGYSDWDQKSTPELRRRAGWFPSEESFEPRSFPSTHEEERDTDEETYSPPSSRGSSTSTEFARPLSPFDPLHPRIWIVSEDSEVYRAEPRNAKARRGGPRHRRRRAPSMHSVPPSFPDPDPVFEHHLHQTELRVRSLLPDMLAGILSDANLLNEIRRNLQLDLRNAIFEEATHRRPSESTAQPANGANIPPADPQASQQQQQQPNCNHVPTQPVHIHYNYGPANPPPNAQEAAPQPNPPEPQNNVRQPNETNNVKLDVQLTIDPLLRAALAKNEPGNEAAAESHGSDPQPPKNKARGVTTTAAECSKGNTIWNKGKLVIIC